MNLKRKLASNLGLILFSGALMQMPIHAQDWVAVNNSNLNTPSNWANPAAVPGIADTANFGSLGNPTPFNPSVFSIGTMDFNQGGRSYFINSSNASMTINTGVVNNSDLPQIFLIQGDPSISTLTFTDGASTDSGPSYKVSYIVQTLGNNSAEINFNGDSVGNGLVYLGLNSKLQLFGNGKTVQLGALGATSQATILLGTNNTLKIGSANIDPNFVTEGGVQFSRIEAQITGNNINLIKEGSTALTLTNSNNIYSGITTVDNGNLIAGSSGSLSPNSQFVINPQGILELDSGTTNTIQTLSNSGITKFRAGAQIGTLNINGNYTQTNGALYLSNFFENTSDSINITGTASLSGEVKVLNGLIAPINDFQYTIITSSGRIGEFTNISTESEWLNAYMTYDATNAYLTFQTAFLGGAATFNEEEVAIQLDSVKEPSLRDRIELGFLLRMTRPELQRALEELSGEQHAVRSLSSQIINHQFIRRLYDPLRPIVTTLPCPCTAPNENVSIWLESGVGGANLKDDIEATGFKMCGYEITLGAQKTFKNNITLGAASSYAYNQIQYNLTGNEKVNTVLGGIYGLYRPENFYALADVAYGYSQSKMHRTIDVGPLHFDAKSRPKISEITAYGEVGVDFSLLSILIQPFIGVEVSEYLQNQINEGGAKNATLSVLKQNLTFCYGNVGLHITQDLCSFIWSIDAAYLYRFNPYRPNCTNEFVNFGKAFLIHGVEFNKSGFEGTFNIAKTINNNFRIYAEVSGQVWDRLAWVTALAGIQYSW